MKLTRPVLVNGILVGVIVLALVGGGLWLWHPWSASAAQANGTQLTATVQQGPVSQTVTASGSISPVREVSPSFQVSGTVATVDVAVGQTVTAGQQLGTIDATELRTTASEDYTAWVYAKQDLAAAESSASSAASAPGGGQGSADSTSSINSAKSAVTKAYDTYQQAEAQLAEATLTSPIAGLVVAVNGEVGGSSGGSGSSSSGSGGSGTGAGSSGAGGGSSSSSGGSGFVTIADTSSYVVTANIAEADISDVQVGQAASVTFPALTGTTATAKVTAISPTATASNSVVTYATTITLDSLPAKVRLGQTAQVAITVATSGDDALYVPAAAISTANGTSTVKVVKNGTTSTVDVTTGVVGDQGTEITKGLTAGETIVIGTVSASGGTTGTGTTGTGTRGGFGGTGVTGGFGGGGFGGGTGGFGGGAGGGFRLGSGGNG